MNQKRFANIILIIVVVILVCAIAYFAFVKKLEPVVQQPTSTTQTSVTTSSATPSLSIDHKNIIVDGKVLLTVDNDTIFNWFKNESHLCDWYNLNSNSV